MSRKKILQAVRRNKPSGHPLPEPPDFSAPTRDLAKAFTLVSEGSGTTVVEARPTALASLIDQRFPEAKVVFSTVDEVPSRGLDALKDSDPHRLQPVDVAIMRGQIGVAENGAIWVDENELAHRVSAFITQHLVLLLRRENIVWNMHEAYRRIQVDATGYGVFIAGPSKTADIEQSLVIGAQGARSLTVVLF